MPDPPSRLRSILGHLAGGTSNSKTKDGEDAATYEHRHHIHQLSPTFFLERAVDIEPEAEAVVHTDAAGRTLRRSYRAFADRARGLAYYLAKRGLRRVGVLAPNTPAHLEAIYGVVAAGGVLVPVNYRLKEDDVAYILGFADVDLVIADAEVEPLLARFVREHPRVPVLVDTDAGAAEGEEPGGPYGAAVQEGLAHDRDSGGRGWAGLRAQAADEDGMIAIPFTSGTTSRPKGVVYTHRGAYLAALANVVESGLNVPDGRCKYLWTLPMFHAIGWTFPWAVCAVRGTHVCLRKIDYPLIWKLLKEEGITHFNAAPTVNTLLCAAQEAEKLPQPVRVTVAASPPTAHLFEQMTELNLHPVHVYGMTETYGPITKGYILAEWDGLPKRDKYARMARQGHGFVTSLPIRVIKTDGPDGEGEGEGEGGLVDVARDGREIGEIVFRGNICAWGYYKNPEATRKLFEGGVLHSGDLAVWHPDGSAQILDRSKDIIISGGENISSVALEGMLVQHPDVLEAGVVAVPDDKWGERPKAYLTVREGKAIRPDDFIAWARRQPAISRFMVPREVDVVAELPKTSTGKIQKNVLREWAKKAREDGGQGKE